MSRLAVAVAPLLLLVGCASTGVGGRTLASGASTTLVPGESVGLPDASVLTYVGVQSDSRCPPKVYCIHAGSATVTFRHSVQQEVRLETGKTPSAAVGAWRLQLVGLDFGPSPKATIRLDPAS